jgi:transmembrane sensor
MTEQQLQELIRKYLTGTASGEERERLNNWYKEQSAGKAAWFSESPVEEERLRKEMLGAIALETGQQTAPRPRLWPRMAAAASVILVLSAGAYFFNHRHPASKEIARQIVQDIFPGSNKAILTLSDGRQISLTDASNGEVAMQAGAHIQKTPGGQIVYQADPLQTAGTTAKGMVYNSVETPRGGQTAVRLADGSVATLDAGSSIRFPVSFTGNERKVDVTGEVYFEVVHDAQKPFRVAAAGQTIEVLGTSFNVNAYTDEETVNTTLVTGKIKVQEGSRSVVLKPGQQAVVAASNRDIKIRTIDVPSVIAWKEGHFHFDNDNVQTVMRQLARWYDVKVEYVGTPTKSTFSGDIDRHSKASVVLKILSLSNVKFAIDGQKIIVSPN